jgi:hypothetical protein
MFTMRGEIPEDQLRREEMREAVPCGTCVTIKFYAADGELVRSDVAIEVDPKLLAQSSNTSTGD